MVYTGADDNKVPPLSYHAKLLLAAVAVRVAELPEHTVVFEATGAGTTGSMETVTAVLELVHPVIVVSM